MQKFTPVFALALVLTTGTLLAQQENGGNAPGTAASASPSPATTAQPGAVDGFTFLNKTYVLNYIHHLNNLEMQEGQTALSRAQSEQLAQYARTLIDDHTANDQRLQEIANSQNVVLQGFQPSTYDVAVQNELLALPFDQFDRLFARYSAQEHRGAIQELQRLNGLVQEAEVQATIAQKITELQGHEQQAMALASGAVQPSPSPTSSPSVSPSPTQSPGVAAGE